MDDFRDLLDALPTEDYHEPQIPPAKPDAAVTVLSLPTEVLQEVAEYSQTRDVLSLMRTNRVFYAVGLRRFYESAYLLGNRWTGILSKLPVGTAEDLVSKIKSNKAFQHKLGVLGGLLCQKRHIAHVKRLVIVDYPVSVNGNQSKFNTLLRFLLENAVLLQTFELRGVYADDKTLDFADMQLPFKYLQHITTKDLTTQPTASIIKQVNLASLQVISYVSIPDLIGTIINSSTTLSYLSCRIQLNGNVDIDEAYQQLDELAASIPCVATLSIGFWSYIEAERENELRYIGRLIQKLPRLRELIINQKHWSDNSMEEELAATRICSEANGQLQRLRFGYAWMNYSPKDNDAILWKRDNEVGDELSWTPSPMFHSRWSAWIKLFHSVDKAHNAMVERWGSVLSAHQIPSIEFLTMVSSYRPRALSDYGQSPSD